ncbi:hypothetical protein BH11PSE2_BH11PSE2_11520 [soil metagenome]
MTEFANKRRLRGLLLGGALIAAVSGSLALAATNGEGLKLTPVQQGAGARADDSVVVGLRRITATQYRHTIADLFGPAITVEGRFEPDNRKDGLIALGAATSTVSTSGFSQYFSIARKVSDQVLDPKVRDAAVPCKPANAAGPDDACTEAFVRKYGPALFRRPLTAGDVATRVKLANEGATTNKDFYAGLKLAMASLLTAPDFLFRVEQAEPDPAKPGQMRLDGYTKATRLAALIWDTAPDPELLRAAGAGELHNPAGLQKQIDRLVGDPRVEAGMRAFFEDMLQFDRFETLAKDGGAYPKYNAQVAAAAREQTLKFLMDHLLTQKGDYRDVFTSRETFMNRSLAGIYQVPYTYDDAWMRMTFPQASGQSGLLTQTTFMMLFSQAARSSPTLRGVGIYEIFLCQPLPTPPANVDFSKVRDNNKNTVRDRLIDHAENPGCSGCHRVSDPPGLALERFDGMGQTRMTENGKLIDVSATMMGIKFEGAQGLGKVLHDSPATSACLVRNVYAYGVGQAPDDDAEDFLAAQTKRFAASGYRVPELIKQIATTPEFFKVTLPKGRAVPAPKVAEQEWRHPDIGG